MPIQEHTWEPIYFCLIYLGQGHRTQGLSKEHRVPSQSTIHTHTYPHTHHRDIKIVKR